MDKTEFILRSLTKITHKRWEHYVVGRVIHLLDDPDIEFACQQSIRTQERGNPFLADLFFPQLGLYLEIDEIQHEHPRNIEADIARTRDIIDATGFDEVRILTHSGADLATVNKSIADFVDLIGRRKLELVRAGTFMPWEYDKEFDPETHLALGKMAVGPKTVFRRQTDAMRCFGFAGKGWQKGAWRLPDATMTYLGGSGNWCLWFPRLYPWAGWKNRIFNGGTEIIEERDDPTHEYMDHWDRRIVMARSRDELNRTLYRFVGVFEPVPEYRTGHTHLLRLVDREVRTIRS